MDIVAELAAQTPSAAAAKDPNTLTKNGDVAGKALPNKVAQVLDFELEPAPMPNV